MKLTASLAAALVLTAVPALAAEPAAAFRMEVVNFPSDPPGEIKQAPGGGRVLTPAILFTPPAGANIYGPAVVLLDQGPGSHPLEQGQATRFAGERLAAMGYTVLSLYSGQERGYNLTPFAETVWPIKAALDYLEMSGYEDFALAGQGYGAIAVANYLATQPDTLMDNGGERRVKATILINPLTELRNYPGADLGRGYEAKVARAEASVKSGRGLYPKVLVPGQPPSKDVDPWVAAGAYTAPPQGFLDYWSPAAAARNDALLAKLPVPTLVLASSEDRGVSMGKLKALRTGAGADLLEYPGDRGRFAGREAKATTDMAAWLGRQGLGPRPGVTLQPVDVPTDGGRVLQGVLYRPEKPLPNKPAVMLIHGRSGDTVQSSTHWMGWRLAQKGYTVIAPGLRISGSAGFNISSLAETAQDIGRWVDRAEALGHRRLVLGGHSNGGIWLSNYISLSKDPRVVGTLYFAPTRDSPAHSRETQGDASYAESVRAAERAVKAGRGDEEMIGLLTARAYLDNNGPRARAVHTARVREFTLPGLAIVGAKDPLMAPAFVDAFKAAYRGKLDLIRYENGSHGFRENKDRLVDDSAAWLARTFP